VALLLQRAFGMQGFRDRRDAGQRLAECFDRYIGNHDVVVLGLPRGGVPVAYEIAVRIGAPLDVLVVRKIGVPGHSELAMGAIASGGVRIVDQRIADTLGVTREQFAAVERRERQELERREQLFRAGPPIDIVGKTAILVDDGLATGASMAAAVDAIWTRDPTDVICAVPVAPPEACAMLAQRATEMYCLLQPEEMHAVGAWYDDFTQTTDDEVRELLADAADQATTTGSSSPTPLERISSARRW
jgi:predicted phosphoribosyltransferase